MVGYSLCIATYLRQDRLAELLKSLAEQDWLPDFKSWELVIVDNDENGSAKSVCDAFFASVPFNCRYEIEPARGISAVRNRLWIEAKYDDLIYVDDDQSLAKGWFRALDAVWKSRSPDVAAGITAAPPIFPSGVPKWIAGARVFQRRRFADGEDVPRYWGRTCGAIIHKPAWGTSPPFAEKFGRTGGVDSLFFHKLVLRGYRVIGIGSAVTYEHWPVDRCTFRWVLLRNFRVGYTTTMAVTSGRLLVGGAALSKLAVLFILLFPMSLHLSGMRWVSERIARQLGSLSQLLGHKRTFY